MNEDVLNSSFDKEQLESKVSFGVDVVEIDRMEKILSRTKSFIDKVFSEAEITYCNSHAKPAIHFSTHFAAKEACAKALGTGFSGGLRPTDIEILHNAKGKPYCVLHNKAKEFFDSLNLSELPVSLSYTHREAVGCAIAIVKQDTLKSEEKFVIQDINTELTKHFKEVKKIIDKQSNEQAYEQN